MKPLIGYGPGVNASVRTTCQRQDVHSDGTSPMQTLTENDPGKIAPV